MQYHVSKIQKFLIIASSVSLFLTIFYLRNKIKRACAKVLNAISSVGWRRNRTHRSAIRALCLAESTPTRARKRSIGKEQIDCRYSRKAPASGPSRPDASSTNGRNRLGSSTAAPNKKRGGAVLFCLLLSDSVLDSKRLTGEARAGGVLGSSAFVAAAAASLPASAWGGGGAGSRDYWWDGLVWRRWN